MGRKQLRRDRRHHAPPAFCHSYGSAGGGGWYETVGGGSWWQNEDWHLSSHGDSCSCGPPSWVRFPSVGFIDTHCHLEGLDSCEVMPPGDGCRGYGGWWERSGTGAAATVRHTLSKQPASLRAVISNCCDPSDFQWYEGLVTAWDTGSFRDDRFYFTVGIHPYGASDFDTRMEDEPELEQRMLALASHPRCLGVGECGLDYCKIPETHEAQRRVFRRLCCLAVSLQKPLVLHARDAQKDTLEILLAHVPLDWPIHLHGYTGEAEHVQKLLKTFSGLCVGMCGALTIEEFHGSCSHCAPLRRPGCRFCGDEPDWVPRDTHAMLMSVPMDRLLLETDAPFMPPTSFSGWVCQPWMAFPIAEFVAARKGVLLEDLIEASNRNARHLYGIPKNTQS